MRKVIKAIAIVVVLAMSALAQSNNASQPQNSDHHGRFSKLKVWRHHKDSKETKTSKSNSAAKTPAAQPQMTATAARPRPVKHISDMDDATPAAKPVAKKAHPATGKTSHVQLASSKAPAGKDNMKPAVHHAAQKTAEKGKAKAAKKKSAKPAPKADKDHA